MYATQATRVEHRQLAPISEGHRETDPGWVPIVAGVQQRVDSETAVDDEATRHPEAQTESGAGGGSSFGGGLAVTAIDRTRIEKQELAYTTGCREPTPDEHSGQRRAIEAALQVPRVWCRDAYDRTLECRLGQDAIRLHLGQLGHGRP
jgi:hypothetical protein